MGLSTGLWKTRFLREDARPRAPADGAPDGQIQNYPIPLDAPAAARVALRPLHAPQPAERRRLRRVRRRASRGRRRRVAGPVRRRRLFVVSPAPAGPVVLRPLHAPQPRELRRLRRLPRRASRGR